MATFNFKIGSGANQFNFKVETRADQSLMALTATNANNVYDCLLQLKQQPPGVQVFCCNPNTCMPGPCSPASERQQRV